MKTIQFAKTVIALCILCLTLAGTTSCSKEDNVTVAPQVSIDPKLLGSWEEVKSVFNANGNYSNLTKLTFDSTGEGEESIFDTNNNIVTFERISNLRWFIKSPGVFQLENSLNGEGDVTYSISENLQSLKITFPSGRQLKFKRIN